MYKGIDVSTIQGNINFQAVAASGISFIIARCGVGNGGIDADYNKNRVGAKSANLNFMAYHFIYPLPTISSQPLRDPIKQANYHFNACEGELAGIDCEWPAPQDFSKWGCTAAQINQWMIAYFNEYTSLDNGRKPLLYTYPYWASAINFDQQFTQYPLWIASYQASPAIPHPWTDWVMWQNSGGSQHLPNGGVPVDTDVAKDLSLWTPTVAPVIVAPPAPVVVAPTPDPVVVAPAPPPPPPPPATPVATPPIDILAPINPFAPIGSAVSGIINWIKKF
jgi:GH25 family lysozyme M1 (1,4-beta-N-acetylmuramidase)